MEAARQDRTVGNLPSSASPPPGGIQCEAMLFLRKKPHRYTFSERLSMLREAHFTIQEQGEARAVVLRDDCAAVIEQTPGGGMRISRAGLVIGREIAALVSLGYQTVWETPGGERAPARASQLRTYHDFLQDLRWLLGIPSLYNESLGTVNARHQYDRLRGREQLAS